jgi:hypothetical protein
MNRIDEIEDEMSSVISEDQWEKIKPLISEMFEKQFATVMIELIIKNVHRNIYEPVLLAMLDEADKKVESSGPGSDATEFEVINAVFNKVRTGDPNEAFNDMAKIARKSLLLDEIVKLHKNDDESKFDKINDLLERNKDVSGE